MSKLLGKDKGLSAIREAKKQLSFDLEDGIMSKIKSISIRDGISPNDVVRRVIGLDVSKPKRPRISLSMTQSELIQVSSEMDINPDDSGQLKRSIKKLIETEYDKE
jgi:hypothetical protein